MKFQPLILILVSVLISTCGTIEAADWDGFASFFPKKMDENLILFVGVTQLQLTTTNMRDVHVSDWENYGTGVMEGRVRLPLSQGEHDGGAIGYVIGSRGRVLRVPFICQVIFAPAATAFSYTNILLGIDLRFVENESFRIGFAPKIGYGKFTGDFGLVEMLPNKTPPVITPEGTFRVGDQIESDLSGMTLQASFNADFIVHKKLGVFFEAGWTESFFGDFSIQAGDIDLAYDSPTIVEPILDIGDGHSSSEPANISPTLTSSGITYMLGLSWHW